MSGIPIYSTELYDSISSLNVSIFQGSIMDNEIKNRIWNELESIKKLSDKKEITKSIINISSYLSESDLQIEALNIVKKQMIKPDLER